MRRFRRRVRDAVGRLVFRGGIHRAFWRQKALIVAFHRIDDRYPTDELTCSKKDFIAYCDFFQRHFHVVSLTELVDKLERRKDISRNLAITFDDGYRDNFDFAAVELEKRGLPACFFVTTGFIGTSQPAWWDEGESIASEWMNWDQLRDLARRGFEIGAHTVTHPNLGVVRGPEAEREILGSKQRLESELRRKTSHFAYPYGGHDNFLEENRDLVRGAEFRSCLSVTARLVGPGTSPFLLSRLAPSPWFGSPYDFGLGATMEQTLVDEIETE